MVAYSSVYGSPNTFGTNNISMSTDAPTISSDAMANNVGGGAGGSVGMGAPDVAGATTPQVSGPGGMGAGAKPGFFSEFGPAQFALGAIQTLGSLWNSFQQNKLAKKSFEFQKEAYNTNLRDTRKNYNTALEDRINARYVTEGKSQAQANETIAQRRL
jgi:hypothetical protein